MVSAAMLDDWRDHRIISFKNMTGQFDPNSVQIGSMVSEEKIYEIGYAGQVMRVFHSRED